MSLFENMGKLSMEIFPKATSIEHLIKLKNEADETINDPKNIIEYADCLLALFAACYKAGYTYEDLLKAGETKMEILKNRNWKIIEDGTYQHF